MLEAISAIVAMAFLCASVAAIIGVIIGFRRKQWKLAIIAGSVTAGLFVVIAILMGVTDEFDDPETETAQAPVEQVPTPAPASPVPELAPAAVDGLSISRDEVQKQFERQFQDQGIIFEPTVSTEGTPAVIGSVDSKRMGVVLEGTENELLEASVLSAMGGASDQEVDMQVEAMNLIGNLLIPEWEEREIWTREAIQASIGNTKVTNLATMQNGKLVKFSFNPTTTHLVFAIELQPSTATESVSLPKTKGLGISRAKAQKPFEDLGYIFESTISRSDSQPQTIAFNTQGDIVVTMTGPDNNLVTAWVMGDAVDAPEETAIAMALLAQTVMPLDFDSVVEWISNTISSMTSDLRENIDKDYSKIYGDKKISLDGISVTGEVTFKVDAIK